MMDNKPDIVTVIAPYLTLQKTGKYYKALCPFHSEKHPSFTVDPAKQKYHCFGCGAGGDSIQFVMDFHKLTFKEALSFLGINGKPSKKTAYKTLRDKHQRKLVNQFREWCEDYYDDLCSLYRTLQKAKEESKTMEEVLAPFYHAEPIWLHHIEILQSDDNKAKLNLYREVIHGS